MTHPTNIPGGTLVDVLPATNKYWFQQPHLLRLNLILLVPLLSSSTFGYDGKKARSLLTLFRGTNAHLLPRLFDERASVPETVAGILR